jgi:hypothetical protein
MNSFVPSRGHTPDKKRLARIASQKLVVLRMRTDPEPHDIFTVHSAQGAIPEPDPLRVDRFSSSTLLKWSPGWEGFHLKSW